MRFSTCSLDACSSPLPSFETVPESGATTGVSALLLVFTSIEILKTNVVQAFKSRSLEGMILAVHDIIKAPLKLIIGTLSAISLLSMAAKFLAISIGVVMSPLALATCALVFTIISALYLTMELVRSAHLLDQSIAFLDNEQIGASLKHIQVLEKLKNQTPAKRAETIKQYQGILEKTLGEKQVAGLAKTCTEGGDKLDLSIKKASAVFTYIKLKSLSDGYLNLNEIQNFDYFARRIGGFAARAFFDRVQAIHDYSKDSFKLLDPEKLDAFIDGGKRLLEMVNKQAHKVIEVHAFSIFVILFSGFALAISAHLIPLSAAIVSILASVGAAVFSLIRGFATEGYIDNAGIGFSLRLSIPGCLAPKDGERVWSIWRSTSSGNIHLDRFTKCLYVFGSVVSVGILPLFDGAIYKASWIKTARGNGADYDLNPNYEGMIIPSLNT